MPYSAPIATAIHPAGTWDSAADRVALSHAARLLRRKRLTAESGMAFVVDLPAEARLHDGDALALSDGRLVAVIAAPEPLWEVTAPDPLRLVWHLGARRVACALHDDRILVQRDQDLHRILTAQGANLHEIDAPFSPQLEPQAVHDGDRQDPAASAHHHLTAGDLDGGDGDA